MELTRRSFVLSAISMTLFASYQNRAFACNVEATYDSLKHIKAGVLTMWGVTALEAIVVGTTMTFTIPVFVTIVGVAAAYAVFKQNEECLKTGFSKFLSL